MFQAKFPKPKGQGLVEYALILAFVAVVAIVVLTTLGRSVGNTFSTVSGALEGRDVALLTGGGGGAPGAPAEEGAEPTEEAGAPTEEEAAPTEEAAAPTEEPAAPPVEEPVAPPPQQPDPPPGEEPFVPVEPPPQQPVQPTQPPAENPITIGLPPGAIGPTETPVETNTPLPSETPVPSATATFTHTPTNTPTDLPTNTPTHTPTHTYTPSPTHTHTPVRVVFALTSPNIAFDTYNRSNATIAAWYASASPKVLSGTSPAANGTTVSVSARMSGGGRPREINASAVVNNGVWSTTLDLTNTDMNRTVTITITQGSTNYTLTINP